MTWGLRRNWTSCQTFELTADNEREWGGEELNNRALNCEGAQSGKGVRVSVIIVKGRGVPKTYFNS